MKRLLKSSRGFTLVELMIVIVIVGVLAAVAIPIYQANVKRAKGSEAEAALGSIRTSARVFYAEYGRYPIATSATAVTSVDSLDISTSDLTGKYYSSSDYYYISTADGDSFEAKADVSDAALDRMIDQSGNIYRSVANFGF